MRPRDLLLPLSLIFAGVTTLRRWLYRHGWLPSVHLGPRTISVGNIDVGGTGKSPFVSGLVSALVRAGHRPVVLARGYKSGLPSRCFAIYRAGELADVRRAAGKSHNGVAPRADEARMVSAQNPSVPVIIGADRVAAFRAFSGFLSGYQPTHVVLDDGFQHLRIRRDVDVVLVGEDFRGDYLLPAGNLREPVASLERASLVVRVTGRDPSAASGAPLWPVALPAGLPVVDARVVYGDLVQVTGLPGDHGVNDVNRTPPRNPLVTCAIARPAAFIAALASLGIKPSRTVIPGDHDRITMENLRSSPSDGVDGIVTTLKDYWRDPEIMASAGFPVWILPMSIEFPYEKLF